MEKEEFIMEDFDSTLNENLYEPLKNAFENDSIKKRKTIEISDWEHLYYGVNRVLSFNKSGRAFVQTNTEYNMGAYFCSYRSNRRLNQLQLVNDQIVNDYESTNKFDPFAEIESLDRYAIYAGDGHYHQHATHDKKHENGKNYPVGHVYMIDLRTQLIKHIDVARPKNKVENEITFLKRVGAERLRMGEPTGTKVIMVYDRAVIDFDAWYNWKHSKGLYIITREKSNMSKDCIGENEYDKNDPINAGVISDQLIENSKGTMNRRIVYRDSKSNKIYVYITNVMDVPPGVIAYIYKKRWEIEKVYDTYKNFYFEKKAWGTTPESKCQQANFMCITHNLLLIFERMLEIEHDIKDTKVEEKQKKRINESIKIILKRKLPINTLAVKYTRSVQRSSQFLREILLGLEKNVKFYEFLKKVKPYMERYVS
jgi:hypothetical protein